MNEEDYVYQEGYELATKLLKGAFDEYRNQIEGLPYREWRIQAFVDASRDEAWWLD